MLEVSKGNVNNLLKTNGKPGINFSKEEENVLGNFKSQIAKSLRKTNMTPQNFLSSMGASFGNSSPNSSIAEEYKSEEESKASSTQLNQLNQLNNVVVGANEAAESFLPNINGNELSAENTGIADNTITASKESIDDYEISNNDINTNSATSIFELISLRYVKSGYPRLFKKIELEKEEVK